MLKRYNLPSVKCEGWARIVIDTEWGFFATVSDWGSYAYIWTAPGGEFRAFLMRLEPDYLYGKLMMGRPSSKEFDGEKTKVAILDAIEQANEESKYESRSDVGWAYYKQEKALLKLFSFDDHREFEEWAESTRLEEAHDYACWRPCHDCMGFCTKVWPRFVELLKKELYDEEKGHREAEILKAAKPAIIAKAKSRITKMTGPDRND